MRRAHSLVEIGIAASLLLLAILPLFGLFSSSGRQGRQTGDQGLTLALVEKVAEELRVAAWENPHAPAELRENRDLARARAVVDGASPFFEALEDLREPFGVIEPGVDPALGADFGAVHRAFSTHQLAYSAAPAVLPTGAADDLALSSTWTGYQHEEIGLALLVRLPERAAASEALPNADRALADQLDRAFLYPTATGSLAAAAPGADLAVVRALGDVTLFASGYAEVADAHAAALADARAAGDSDDPVIAARGRLAFARLQERRAAQALVVLACLLEPLRTLSAPGAATRLGATPPAPRRIHLPLMALAALPAAFTSALADTRAAYAAALASPALAPRARIRVLIKLAELAKLAALTGPPAELTVLRDLLTYLRDTQTGRNPNFAHYATVELERATDLTMLGATYPRPEPARWAQARDLVRGVVDAFAQRLP